MPRFLPASSAEALNRNQIKLGGVSPSCVCVFPYGLRCGPLDDWTMKEEERIVYFAI